ncbi:MAG: hypothetical protein AB7O97_23810 [Planctomycetota bacterium]
MIRGPVVPLQRDGLWRLLSQRPELFERGLRVVAEGLDLGTEGLGLVDGLLRDAGGSPVLVFASGERDAALPARVVAAHAFWRRNAAGMPRALPEADLREPERCRLLVLGTGLSAATIDTLRRLRLDELEVVEVDTFQVGGQERLVVRPVLGAPPAAGGRAQSPQPPIDAAVGSEERARFRAFDDFARTLDPKIRVEGDRFSRRASFEGRPLGECWFADDLVLGAPHGGTPRPIASDADLRVLGDQIARRYLALLDELTRMGGASGATAPAATEEVAASARGGFETLRASLSAARLSADECSALMRGRDGSGGPEDEQEGPLADD